MNYSKELKELVASCLPHTYIGTGNPNAPILIIGKECAIDIKEDIDGYLREIAHNAEDWDLNIRNNVDPSDIDNWLTKQSPKYNPLYPYKGQQFKRRSVTKGGSVKGDGGTSATWYNYQKLFNLICNSPNNQEITFHEHCFITEMNQETGRYSKDIPDDERSNSILKRSQLLRSSFFQQFPIVIVACGHYIRDYNINIEEIFNVKWQGPTIDVNGNWLNVHSQSVGNPQLLIHTNQLSINIADELLRKIAEKCIDFIKQNNIKI